MIEVKSVSKWYGEKKAVNDLSFTIGQGEIVGLLGLNGAGKSTILKTLGTLTQASQGEAYIAGYSVRDQAASVRQVIGYLPDTPPLYEEMSVLSYLQFVAGLKGVPKAQRKGAVEEVIAKTQLDSVIDRKLGELSHGFKQRANIAQALVHKPKVLILDEPINGLDPIQIVEMRDLILSLRTQHTVMLSSHILSEITKTCDRILVIDQGRLVAEGSEEELRQKADDKFWVELLLETESPERLAALLPRLEKIPFVDSATLENGCILLNCSRDVRSNIARLVVEDGYGLLSLRRKEAELETLFLKLVSGEKS